MQEKIFEEYLKEIAEKHGIPSPVLEKAWKNQFKVVREVISNSERGNMDSFKTVYIRHVGKFVPRVSEMKYMAEHNKKRDDKGDN